MCVTLHDSVQFTSLLLAILEGEGLAGTTQDKVSVHWSERWCRHGTWTNCGIEISSCLRSYIVEWLSQSVAVTTCSCVEW